MTSGAFPDRGAGGGLLTDPSAFGPVRDEVVRFVRDTVARTGRGGAVVTLRGRVGSTVAAVLAVEALDPHRVLGLVPSGRDEGTVRAETVAQGLGIEYREPPLATLLDLFEDEVAPAVTPRDGERAAERAADGLVDVCARYAAAATNRLVLGATNRTEWLLGDGTRTDGGAADLLPVGDLYACEVRALARHLGVPGGAMDPSEVAEARDRVLHRLVDGDEGIEQVAAGLDVDPGLVREYARILDETRHARAPIPTPGNAARGYDHFHELELRFE